MSNTNRARRGMGQTITEKILSRVEGRAVITGEIFYPKPDLVTVHDWYVVNFDRALEEFGVTKLFDPSRVLISTDHEPVAVSPQSAERQKKAREIVAKYGITQFYDVGRGGLGHMFPIEMGLVKPGMFVEAYDTHVTNFGAVGALAIPLVVEISEVLALGSVWLRVPETVRVNLAGKLQFGTSIRDIAQKLIADLGGALIDYSVVEFGGSGLADLDIAARHTLCNTPLEIGAKSALVEPDAVTLAYLEPGSKEPLDLVTSDDDANFKAVIDYDLSVIGPQVALPPTPDNVHPVGKVAGTPIQHAFIGSCASGNLSDLADAARILRGRRVHPAVRLYVTPGTQHVAREAANTGLLQVFLEAGATMTQAGCGPCAGGRIGGMAEGETSINTGTRNDPRRLGASGDIYLASPFTVAASAVTGAITDPRSLLVRNSERELDLSR
jgi:3-isopropylmalate/(R)-2-methylmalate dehydratase large subunit